MKRTITWSVLMLIVLIGAALKYSRPAASSTSTAMMPPVLTLNVNSTADILSPPAGVVTLRSAIAAANADASANPAIINLTVPGTYNLTLTNGTQENGNTTGDLDIVSTNHTVTINGLGSSGPSSTTISAAGLNGGTSHDRVFHITTNGMTVTFSDLAITDGRAVDDGTSGTSTVDGLGTQTTTAKGGAILNSGGNLTLNNVILDNNQAVGGDGANCNNCSGQAAQGGSIWTDGGTLTITTSQFLSSTARGGDGGDTAADSDRNGGFGGTAQGGGVWVGGGSASITDTTFDSTAADGGDSGIGGNGSEPAGPADGGGLYSNANVTVTNSTFHLAAANGGDGNTAVGASCLGAHIGGDGGGARGGAIFAQGGSLTIDTSTFANNSAAGGNGGSGGSTTGACGVHGSGGFAYGGAFTNDGATVNIKHATISGNNAQAGNSGVNQGVSRPPRLVAEGTGGGIRVGPGSITLENTIIAGNTAANGAGDTTGAPTPGPNVDGTVTSNGHNMVGDATEATGFTAMGDQTGVDPLLLALADNGGPTQTMALSPTGPAIDAGTAAGATFDQRGKARTYDDPGVTNAATSDGTDIGAFELQPLCSLTCPDDITVPNDPDECGAIVTYPDPSGAGCGTITCDHPSGSFFDVGETTVTCTSSVGPTCNFKVTVNDAQGPDITTKNLALWSPNHKYANISVGDLVTSASDNCDSSIGISTVRIAKVTSDESNNSAGDGNTGSDIVIAAGCSSVQLRAERKGNGNGRVYTITFTVTDSAGNTSTATAKVTVAKSQNGSPAIDDGPSYTVNGCP